MSVITHGYINRESGIPSRAGRTEPAPSADDIQGIYQSSITDNLKASTIADTTTPLPNSKDTYRTIAMPATDGSSVAFYGCASADGTHGVYYQANATTRTPAPIVKVV